MAEAMVLRYLVVASLLLSGCAAAQDVPDVGARRYYGPPPISLQGEIRFDRRCYSTPDTFIDLYGLLFLRNTTVEPSMGFSRHRVEVEGERVTVTEIIGDEEISETFRVDHLVRDDPDVELSLALFEGRLFVHWRETFQHRRYREGLLRLNDRTLEVVCEGVSGVNVTH